MRLIPTTGLPSYLSIIISILISFILSLLEMKISIRLAF